MYRCFVKGNRWGTTRGFGILYIHSQDRGRMRHTSRHLVHLLLSAKGGTPSREGTKLHGTLQPFELRPPREG